MLITEQFTDFSSWNHVCNLIRTKSVVAEFNAFLGTNSYLILKTIKPLSLHLFNCWSDLELQKHDCDFIKSCLSVKFEEQINFGQVVIHDQWIMDKSFDVVFYNIDNVSLFESDFDLIVRNIKHKGHLILRNFRMDKSNRVVLNSLFRIFQTHSFKMKGAIDDTYVLQLD